MLRFSFSFPALGVNGTQLVESCAIFSSASTSFFWVLLSVSLALVSVSLTVVALSEAVAVARFAIALVVSVLYSAGAAFAVLYLWHIV